MKQIMIRANNDPITGTLVNYECYFNPKSLAEHTEIFQWCADNGITVVSNWSMGDDDDMFAFVARTVYIVMRGVSPTTLMMFKLRFV